MDRVRRRTRAEKRLRVSDLAKLPPGTHEDGGGLRLVVEPDREDGKPGPRRWVLRVTIAGKRHNRGLGPYPLVTLDKAREQATDIRRAARDGRDLIRELEQHARQSRHLPPGLRRLLREPEEDAVEQPSICSSGLRRWRPTSSRRSATCRCPTSRMPSLGILEPIWFDKAETARRVLQRMELVFKSAILRGQREKASPCVGVRQELGVTHLERRASPRPALRRSARLHHRLCAHRPPMRSPNWRSSG